MKAIFMLLALLLASTAAQAQVKMPKLRGWVNPLPLDSISRKVTYRAVVQAPGVSRDELYARAKKWFAAAPSTTKQALDTDDATAGRLVGRTGELVTQNFLGASVQVPLWRTITIEVKAGRYRYSITDFAFDSGKGLGAVTPIENYLTPNALTFDDNGYPKPVLQATIESVQRSGRQQAASIKQTLSGTASTDNW